MLNWTWFTELSVVHGRLHVLLLTGAGFGLLGLLLLRRTRTWWTRSLPLSVLSTLGLLALGWLVLDVTKPWPDGVPGTVGAWIGVGLLALALLALGWRRQRWWVRASAVAAALFAVVGAAVGVDTVYGSFPTVGSVLQMPPYGTVAADEVLRAPVERTTAPVPGRPLSQAWQAPAQLRSAGAVIHVHIPATRSGFAARAAWVYVPPAYFAADRPLLPVLMLIGGQPGGPRDWLDGGRLAQRMDAWANAHGGLAPVVVMPDALGSPIANPMCLDSALGRTDTYLAQDVPAWVVSSLQVDPDHSHWAVGGFSFGGTCALQLAVAHPDLFPTFIDESGQQAPTLGDRSSTVAAAFSGNEAAYAAQDPLTELASRRRTGSAGYLVVGAQDPAYQLQARAVATATTAAGISVTLIELPGGHSWSVWGAGLDRAMPWLSTRMGLTP
ncbi:MAG: xynZ [Modestobacter sp.]|nr:xynZ [Modestobacter sp.]